MDHAVNYGWNAEVARSAGRFRDLYPAYRLRLVAPLEQLVLDLRPVRFQDIHSALLAQTAVMVGLLLAVPMRLRNLAELRIGTHLGGWNDHRMSLSVQGDQVKNKVPIAARLSAELTKKIRVYVDCYRPLLAADNGDWLFPGSNSGAHKSEDALRSQVKKALAIHCGNQFNPHLYRHFAAWLILQHNPGAYGQVQRILGHKSLHATMAFYSGLETPAALENYDALVERERREPILAQPKTSRLGRN